MSERELPPYRFVCTLANGLHARPASMMAAAVEAFDARVTIGRVGENAGPAVDARSVLSVVGLDVRAGDECEVRAAGREAGAAMGAIVGVIERLLEHGEEPLAGTESGDAAVVSLSRALRELNPEYVSGRAACGGVGVGEAVCVSGVVLPPEEASAKPGPAEEEWARAKEALGWVRGELGRRAGLARAKMEAELLKAHEQIAADPALAAEVERLVRGGRTALQAVAGAAEAMAAKLRGAASQYVRDRAVDVHDVCMQVMERLSGGKAGPLHVTLARDSVVFAEMLTANQLLRMDAGRLKGLVLGHVGATSHTVILARSLRVPTLIDVAGAGSAVAAGQRVVVDGDGGFVVTKVSRDVERFYERRQRTMERRAARLAPEAQAPAVTVDGVGLEVGVNASTDAEVKGAMAAGADGVGLLRTELMFLERETAPTEDEQFEAYAKVVRAAAGKPVIIRTFDIGGDKPATYLDMPREENPFLGVRGLRLYERHVGLFRAQVRAILRASALGPVKIMAPMVALPREAAWFKAQVEEAKRELAAAGAAFDAGTRVGVMVEIPAIALAMDHLDVDFVSIGTNDLTQYWMAVDRGNPGVAGLYSSHHPSFLRLLELIVRGAKSRGVWVGVCGEMASDRRNLALMIGLGVDEISVSPGEVMNLKSMARGVSAGDCRGLVERAMGCASAEEVRGLLESGVPDRSPGRGILDAELISVGSDAETKAAAIREAIELLFVADRTRDVRAVEEAVWAREETYSTGLGYGFAVPHCKTDAVRTPSLAVVQLREAIEWGSMDGQPVGVVILLALPSSEAAGGGASAHMKVFATLARRLMHEEFREKLGAAKDREAIARLLRDELKIG